jgi:hypothetical protein
MAFDILPNGALDPNPVNPTGPAIYYSTALPLDDPQYAGLACIIEMTQRDSVDGVWQFIVQTAADEVEESETDAWIDTLSRLTVDSGDLLEGAVWQIPVADAVIGQVRLKIIASGSVDEIFDVRWLADRALAFPA